MQVPEGFQELLLQDIFRILRACYDAQGGVEQTLRIHVICFPELNLKGSLGHVCVLSSDHNL